MLLLPRLLGKELQQLACGFNVAEVLSLVSEDLIIFVPLAGD